MAVAARICRKLDGLPLAIELAAARLGTLSAAEIEAHLADRFRFLAYRRPVADPRHQALQAAIDWSYDLLPSEERRVLGELSVFAGRLRPGAGGRRCAAAGTRWPRWRWSTGWPASRWWPPRPAEDGTRYRLLETVRHYAADRLAEAGGTEAARHRHAAAFLSLAERERELAVLTREQDNFRAALEWSLARGDQTGPRLARALGSFWLARGLFQEGQDWLERALAVGPADQRLRADLLRLLGTVLFEVGDLRRAEAVLSEGSEVAAAVGAPAVQARIRAKASTTPCNGSSTSRSRSSARSPSSRESRSGNRCSSRFSPTCSADTSGRATGTSSPCCCSSCWRSDTFSWCSRSIRIRWWRW